MISMSMSNDDVNEVRLSECNRGEESFITCSLLSESYFGEARPSALNLITPALSQRTCICAPQEKVFCCLYFLDCRFLSTVC